MTLTYILTLYHTDPVSWQPLLSPYFVYIAVNTDFMGFGLPFIFTPPFLFWLVKDGYKTPPPPQEFALGPTCLVVKGKGEGNSLDFLSSIVLGFCFVSQAGKNTTEKW